ncbi:hypothetical protein H2248_007743 [Termitomyces sp. 'cryptogamus']|nr:hypothetical protein H2248_007743 [Termitomyces sp. 'cryptogamus']
MGVEVLDSAEVIESVEEEEENEALKMGRRGGLLPSSSVANREAISERRQVQSERVSTRVPSANVNGSGRNVVLNVNSGGMLGQPEAQVTPRNSHDSVSTEIGSLHGRVLPRYVDGSHECRTENGQWIFSKGKNVLICRRSCGYLVNR